MQVLKYNNDKFLNTLKFYIELYFLYYYFLFLLLDRYLIMRHNEQTTKKLSSIGFTLYQQFL